MKTLFRVLAIVAGVGVFVSQASAQSAIRHGEQALGPFKYSQGDVTALGNDLFGDSINTFTGGLSFSQTDLSLPGNDALPVTLTRRLVIDGNKSPSEIGDVPLWKGKDFGEWEFDLPYLTGTYSVADGWTVDTATPYARCSSPTAREQFAPRDVGTFHDFEFWSGIDLYVPGQGESSLLARTAENPAPLPNLPGLNNLTTRSNWHFQCTSLANGISGEEGFVGISPDGTKYFFAWKVAYPERALKQYSTRMPTSDQIREMTDYWGTYSSEYNWFDRTVVGPSDHRFLDADSGSEYDPSSMGIPVFSYLDRNRIRIYPTRIEDRFGNQVNYTWSGSKLTSISSPDGRALTITYNGNTVTRVSDGIRAVDYHYENGLLTEVLHPTAKWSFNTSAALGVKRYIPLTTSGQAVYDADFQCQWMRRLTTDEGVVTMTHPSGAVASFTLGFKRHLRTSLDGSHSCALGALYTGENFDAYTRFRTSTVNPDNPDANMSSMPVLYDVLSVKRKALSGPGVPEAVWTFSHSDAYGMQQSLDSNPNEPISRFPANGTRTVTTIRPDLSSIVDVYGTSVVANEGLLLIEEVRKGAAVASHQSNVYVQAADFPNLPFVERNGMPLGVGTVTITDANRPLKASRTDIQGASFHTSINTFDVFARPKSVAQWSQEGASVRYTKTDGVEYYDDPGLWVLGQVKRTTTDGIEVAKTDFGWKAMPWKTYSFGKPVSTFSYETMAEHQVGTVKTVTDANNNVTKLQDWHRGTPKRIEYADGFSDKAAVNGIGQVTSVTDTNEFTTSFHYDDMGLLDEITYPSGDNVAWSKTTRLFEKVDKAEEGIPAGHWKQTVSTGTGNARKVTYFDAFWRPVVTREYDALSQAATQRFQRFAYDYDGRTTFASYPGSSSGLTKGTWTEFDVLGRSTSVSQDSEQGLLVTTTSFPTGLSTAITNPRLITTTTNYKAFGTQTFDWPVQILHPENAITEVERDVFGKPTKLTRRNGANTVRLDRTYSYNDSQQLCKMVEPETGATLFGYDNVGNALWTSAGLPSGTACELNGTSTAVAERKVARTFDVRNRLKTLTFPDGRGNQTWNYHPDGLPSQVYTYNGTGNTEGVLNTYTYNKRRLLTAETSGQIGWYTWALGYGYDVNGNLAAQSSYPDGLTITYSPNALGQHTLLKDQNNQIYAQDVSYYPNGAIKQFTYGNGLTHAMWQTTNRPMPDRSFDCIFVSGACQANSKKLDLSYDYDANGNVSHIIDSKDGVQTRHMTYDGLDRLTQTISNMFGTAEYAYDVLENLTRVRANGRDHTYYYDSKWQLGLVKDAGTPNAVIGLGYDVQGNMVNKNGVDYDFDYGNRLRSVEDRESQYRYDAFGRRVHSKATWYAAWQYSHAGQLMYAQDGRNNRATNYVYLGGSLLAMREKPMSGGSAVTIKYQHTDALGSAIAVTDANKEYTEISHYEPYGKLVNRAETDGPAFTGHVQDAATGLTYMQQRYYDSGIGRFLSVDPVSANPNTGASFNRYAYANNNPYKFTDPDGRDCVSTNGTTTCSTANYVVSFPAQKGFQDFTTKSPNYHAYSVPASTPGKTLEQNQAYVKNNPTPGFSSPATPQGTFNDATPVIGGISPIAISPVTSFSLTNQLNGQPVVVNVTLPGHPLESGIVVRQPTVDANGNSSIQNWGEGTSKLQAPGSLTAKPINGVWTEQKLGTPSPTGCASGRDNVCNN